MSIPPSPWKVNENSKRGGVGVQTKKEPSMGEGRYGYFLEPHNENVMRLPDQEMKLVMISRCLQVNFKIHIPD